MGVEFNARDQRRAQAWRRGGGTGGGDGFGEGDDLERTQRLEGADPDGAAQRRALEETWAADGAQGGDFAQAGAGRGRSGPLSRRVLFAAGGLALVGGCGVGVASKLSSSGSSSAAGSPVGTGPGSVSPTSSASAGTRGASPTATAPGDLSSSTGDASPPPDVANPGSGIDPSKVQSAPEYYVHAGAKVIALTLDDGPSAAYTPQVLDLLQQLKITATFCMVGRQVAANRSLVAEVVAAGHTIVNHTWDHADQSKLTQAQIRSEIGRASDALAAVGVRPAIFRAPYGAWSHALYEELAAADLRPLDWSVDPRDWSRPGVNTIVSRILAATRTGSIILEHDGGGDRSQTVAALRIVLPKLLEQGYRFTTV